MSKRVRYTGSPPGREIAWPPGAVYPEKTWFVETNHMLPDDIPAKLRDELLRSEDFSEVEHSTAVKKDGEK